MQTKTKETFRDLALRAKNLTPVNLDKFSEEVDQAIVQGMRELKFDQDHLTYLQTINTARNAAMNEAGKVVNANLQQLISRARYHIYNDLSIRFGYPVMPLSMYQLATIDHLLKDDKDQIGLVNAIGDGNCGPRAVIQSLLMQGVLKGGDAQLFVLNYLKRIYNDQKDAKDSNGRDLYQPSSKNEIQTSIEQFFKKYEKVRPADLPNLIDDFFGALRPRKAKGDPVIFALAGCLRFALDDYIQSDTDKPGRKLLHGQQYTDNLRTLDQEVDMNNYFVYLAQNGIGLTLDGVVTGHEVPEHLITYPSAIVEGVENPERFNPPTIEIGIYRSSGHFLSLVHTSTDSVALNQRGSFLHSSSRSSNVLKTTVSDYERELIQKYKEGFFTIKNNTIKLEDIETAEALDRKEGPEEDGDFAKRLQEAEFRKAGYEPNKPKL